MHRFIVTAALLAALAVTLTPQQAVAQEKRSGALTVGAVYQRSVSGRDALGVSARAMAVDQVPDTVVGRFGELAAQIGVTLDGEILTWSIDFQLGVGLATDYFVLFLASGFIADAYQSIDDAADDESVDPGFGFPLTLGLWIPIEWFYLYGMMGPRWVILVEDRQVDDFPLFGFGEEFDIRGGFGFDVSELSFRFDYRYHQVEPTSWHSFTLSVGPEPAVLPDL